MERDFEILRGCEGLYVGQLTLEEMAAFNRLCEDGHASRSYEGAGGLMGMAKIKFRRGPLGLD